MKPKQLRQGPAKLMDCTQNGHLVESLGHVSITGYSPTRSPWPDFFGPDTVIQFAAIKDYNLLKFLHRMPRPGDYYNPIFNLKCAAKKRAKNLWKNAMLTVSKAAAFDVQLDNNVFFGHIPIPIPIPVNGKLFTQTFWLCMYICVGRRKSLQFSL